ncbi:hypothetical protein B566_EDAN001038 [Ephemera danica]|nr:hypothetical protein B566_EDAN001038 [Ephemera danica]
MYQLLRVSNTCVKLLANSTKTVISKARCSTSSLKGAMESVATRDIKSKEAVTTVLNREQLDLLMKKLNDEERGLLLESMQWFEAEKQRVAFQGTLAMLKWRSELGRPTQLHKNGVTDPTGTFCPLTEDWLLQKQAAKLPPPTRKELTLLGLHNALPFVGFGFLDNLIMILAGDYIDLTLGLTLGISTMAAAALGNTISDIAGIGSAWYIENLVTKIGFKPPSINPILLNMKTCRRVANLGRALGVCIGCLLGMLPLLLLPTVDKEKKKKQRETMAASSAPNT